MPGQWVRDWVRCEGMERGGASLVVFGGTRKYRGVIGEVKMENIGSNNTGNPNFRFTLASPGAECPHCLLALGFSSGSSDAAESDPALERGRQLAVRRLGGARRFHGPVRLLGSPTPVLLLPRHRRGSVLKSLTRRFRRNCHDFSPLPSVGSQQPGASDIR